MVNYLLPVSGNPNFKQMTWLKHPLQAFLKQYLGDWGISVKIRRDEQALVITDYDGPVDKLIEGISRQAQKGHSSATSGTALAISKLEAIVDAAEPLIIIETDETLRQDIEVLQALLATEAEQNATRLQEAKDEYHKFEGAHKLTLKELAGAQRHSENNKRAFDGISDMYHGQKVKIIALEKRLADVEKSTKTPTELRIDAVRKSAQSIKSLEQELQSLGVSDLKLALAIPASLIDYVNASLSAAYATDEAVRSAANFKSVLPDTAAEIAYMHTVKDIKFYDGVKSLGVDVPEEMQASFLALEKAIGEKKKAISDYESAQRQATEQQKKASKLQELIDLHATAVNVRSQIAKLPPVEIYSTLSEPLACRTYLPVGSKDGFVYRMVWDCFNIHGMDMTEDGLAWIDTITSPHEQLKAVKSRLEELGMHTKVLLESEL